jgi:hypothetical protein
MTIITLQPPVRTEDEVKSRPSAQILTFPRLHRGELPDVQPWLVAKEREEKELSTQNAENLLILAWKSRDRGEIRRRSWQWMRSHFTDKLRDSEKRDLETARKRTLDRFIYDSDGASRFMQHFKESYLALYL